MVQEVAAVILKLHQGGGRHANATSCHHQSETAAAGIEMEGMKQHEPQAKETFLSNYDPKIYNH